jgi:hypothetical protein
MLVGWLAVSDDCCFLAMISDFGVYFRLANLLADRLASGCLVLVCGRLHLIIICLTKSLSAWFLDICLAVSISLLKGPKLVIFGSRVLHISGLYGNLGTTPKNSKF